MSGAAPRSQTVVGPGTDAAARTGAVGCRSAYARRHGIAEVRHVGIVRQLDVRRSHDRGFNRKFRFCVDDLDRRRSNLLRRDLGEVSFALMNLGYIAAASAA